MNRDFRVLLVREAEQDLAEIIDWIAVHDSVERADYVLGQLLDLCDRLESYPARGHVPPELDAIGIRGYREVHFKPYRAIYEIRGRQVIVHVIADGRRSLRNLLERRILR